MDALQRANEIRRKRGHLKRDLKARRVLVEEIIAEPPDWTQTMPIFDLLLAVPRLGRVRVNKTLTCVRISPSKTLGGLTERQRGELLRYLRPHTPAGSGLLAGRFLLTGFQEHVLKMVCLDGALATTELARRLGTDRPHARNMLQALAKRGLVDEDGSPTPAGYRVCEELLA